MQRIERYGVIALVLLLVTILAVSLWGERKSGGNLLSMFGGEKKPAELALAAGEPRPGEIVVGERGGLERAPIGPEMPQRPSGVVIGNPYDGGVGGESSSLPYETVPDRIPKRSETIAPPTHPKTPPPQPPPSGARTCVVRSGETLSEIAARELGSARRWPEIQALNGNIDPSAVRSGTVLRLPPGVASAMPIPERSPERQAAAPKPVAGSRTYVVKPDDTLGLIAQRELGSSKRWTEIRDLNPGINPERLSIGKPIALPAGSAPQVQTVAAATQAPARSNSGSATTRVR